jgi:DNA-binding NarL/FixJ family response regulator
MENERIRVVIADSHDLFRQGLSSLLARQPDVEIVGEARDGDELQEMVQALRPDVLLMEIYMRGVDGLSTVLQMMAEHPGTNVAILTSSEDDNDVLSAVKLGIKGYILKNSSLDELVQAIHGLSQGGAYFSSSMFTKVLQEFTHLARRRDLQEAKGIDALTDREKDVLRLVARGATNRDIAEELVITENTVKVHLRNILDKLQLRNRQQAAAYAVQEGLISRVMPGGYGGYGGRSGGGLRVVQPSAEEARNNRQRLADYKLNIGR